MEQVVLCIGDVLKPDELAEVQRVLGEQTFHDGQASAGWAARTVKHNLQFDTQNASFAALQSLLGRALARHEVFVAAAMPKALRPVVFSRYEIGMSYGDHVDDALMGDQPPLRSDLSFTIFLSGPADYEGGELVIDEPVGSRSFKLPAGSMVLYPSGHLHRVATVTAGCRLAAVGWLQSLIRRAAQRELIFELETVRRELFAQGGKTHAFDTLSRAVSNLWRMWAEP
jgi:PKHD-type hydroxylase